MDMQYYQNRRKALRQTMTDGAILFVGHMESPRTYAANAYVFRQDSHMLYYAGVNRPGYALLLEPDGSEILAGPVEDPDDIVWNGPQTSVEQWAGQAGIATAVTMDNLAERISGLQKAGVTLHYLPASRMEQKRTLSKLLGLLINDVDRGASPQLIPAVVDQRSVKEPGEIAEIENALAVSAQMFDAAARAARPGATEAMVAGTLQGTALSFDRQQAYLPIVTVKGEVLHNNTYTNTLRHGDLMLIDAGAESPLGYASDITRAYPVGGEFTPQQRDIYTIVLGAQQAVIAAAAPGVTNRDLHMLAATTITRGLRDLGLVHGSVEDIVAAGAHALFFPHGIGHMLGLDVHDMEDLGDAVGYGEGEKRSDQFGLSYLRLAKTLQPGFVITVEPGVYFIDALIDRWQAENRHSDYIDYHKVALYRGLGGIRIEDDILITREGYRVLGSSIPKLLQDVEALMGQ